MFGSLTPFGNEEGRTHSRQGQGSLPRPVRVCWVVFFEFTEPLTWLTGVRKKGGLPGLPVCVDCLLLRSPSQTPYRARASVCVECLFSRSPSRAPSKTPPACAKRAALARAALLAPPPRGAGAGLTVVCSHYEYVYMCELLCSDCYIIPKVEDMEICI